MGKIDQLYKAKSLLHQAMQAAADSLPNNKLVMEARQHIRKAVEKIDTASQDYVQKKRMNNSQFEHWWGEIQSGVASANMAAMSPQAQIKSLAQLNAMIDEEKQKLAELEQQVTTSNSNTDTDLLSD